tara:strand:+ start:550 stop:1086 length:537 start_codon:yes stop_codon:yes gene_type:complete
MSETNQLVLIACSKSKLPHRAKAFELYQGDLFKKSWEYYGLLLEQNNYQSDCFILSAKHGLLNPHSVIDPYDETLHNFNAFELAHWARKVEHQIYNLKNEYLIESVIFLAGRKYREPLASFLPYHIINPLEGLGIGEQKQFINEELYKRKQERAKYNHYRQLGNSIQSFNNFLTNEAI